MRLSVVVTTRDRARHVAPCLDSIAAALVAAGRPDAELVVADNGSTDGTPEIIKAWTAASGVPVQSLVEPSGGKAVALNAACRSARGDILVLTDDDCRLDSEHINDLLRHDAADADLTLRGGRIELGDPTDLPLTINTSPTRVRWSRAVHSLRHESLGGKINGCNMTMRRALFERLGPFDEDFGPGSRIGSGDDTDYIFRAYLGDATLEYVPDMMVLHHHGRKTNDAGRKLMTRYMTSNGGLCAKYALTHPNICRPFYWDCKNALKETVTGSNTFMPNLGFSHRDKVMCSLRGAVRYFFLRDKAARRHS